MDKYYIKFILRNRLNFITYCFLIFFLLLILRFFYIQILQNNYYSTQALNNIIKIVPIEPARGLIFDRNNTIIADNKLSYSLEVIPEKIENLSVLINKLSNVVTIDNSDIIKYKRILSKNQFSHTIPIKSNLTNEELAEFSTHSYQFPNVELKETLKRSYPHGALGVHYLGYINRISKKDLIILEKEHKKKNYIGTDHIGKAGVEFQYENELHGVSGYKHIEVNSMGKTLRTIKNFPAKEGRNIHLTIDLTMQKIAEKEFKNKKGALVAMDPNNGEILAYVSMPNYDPSLFIDGINHKSWNKLNKSKDKPLLDRAINGLYPPGSTLKPFVAVAGLKNQLRMPPFKINDPGYFYINNSRRFNDWKIGGHGEVDIIKAISVSCDTFFYGLAIELGIPKLNKTLADFGFGIKTGVDLPNEKPGLLADAKWKKKKYKKKWYVGETAITGIGQGYTQVTPMQLALATSKIAFPNKSIIPHIKLNSQHLKQNTGLTPPINISDQTIEWVKKGMENVTEDGGTAAFIGKTTAYKIAAKTGTAQVFGLKKGEVYDEKKVPDHLKDHALFIAYAPAKNPKITVAVIVENGGHGGSTAGPIAKKIFDYYLTSGSR
ncbi:MAG: penicillin-binding protein 2 [Methylophilaceae bacterium]|nr:penicillin-binding protein 2 [Methylophilaceae bacterium]